MTRRDIQRLARTRLGDAGVLLRARRYGGAYYLCGYAIECGLKACVAKQTRRFDFPDKPTVDRAWTHDLTRLISVAGLDIELTTAIDSDATLGRNWRIVKDWNETSRYQRRSTEEAANLYDAVSDTTHGVLQWLQQLW